MYIILGATGHVGSAVADELLKNQQPVTIITRDPGKAAGWEKKGAIAAVADVHDVARLSDILSTGKRLFFLNPPAPPHTDTDREEQLTVSAILKALKSSAIEKVVAESTYGARPGKRIGDLGTLYYMEESLKKSGVPSTIIRAAYYMSNWKASLDSVIKENKLYSFFPPEFKIPMVAPKDIGRIAAGLLMGPASSTDLHYVEGPERYSSADVANAFSSVLSKTIETVEIRPAEWEETMRAIGFSDKAAASFAGMTRTVLEDCEMPDSPIRGSITIEEYVAGLIHEVQKTIATTS